MSPTATRRGDAPAAAAGASVASAPDPRIAERRRQVEGERRRRLRRRMVGVLVVASLLGAAWGLAHSSLLDAEVVLATGVADAAEAEAVVRASGVEAGDPMVWVDPAEVASRVAALPWVDTASVERQWPAGIVEVAVTPRVAVAAVPAPGGRWVLVDRTGQAIAEAANASGVPVVAGVSVGGPGERLASVDQPLVGVAEAVTPGLATRVAEVRPGRGGEAELLLAGGGVVVLGQPGELSPEAVGVKLRTLRTVLATVDLRCVERIDLRVSDTAVLTRNPSCV